MGPRSQFQTELDSNNGVARVALSGELDIASAPLAEETLDTVISDGFAAVMVDLRELEFIDSSGLHALLRARTRADASGKGLILIGASDAAQRLFKLTGTQHLLGGPRSVEFLDRFAGETPAAPIDRPD